MTPPHFPLEAWWPRKRGQWPGPRAPTMLDDFRFPKGFPSKEALAILQTYRKFRKEVDKAIEIPLTDEERNRLLAEQRNGEEQCSKWQYCTPEGDLEHLELREVHDFCWKVCAFYLLFPEEHRVSSMNIYSFLDSKWFQGVKTPVFCGSFLAKGINLTTLRELPDILNLHRRLCDQVVNRQGTLSSDDRAEHAEKDAKRAVLKNTFWSHVDYHFLPIFRRFFIVLNVLDKPEEAWQEVIDWGEETALLVFTQDDDTERLALDPVNLDELGTCYDVQVEGNTLTGKLGVLVDIVLAMWAKVKSTPSSLNSVAEELHGRLRYIRRDELEALERVMKGEDYPS